MGRPSHAEKTVIPAAEGAPIRVVLADSQAIFRVGISKILSAEPDIQVIAQAETLGQTLAAIASADVLLFETGLSPTPAEALAEVLKRAPSLCVVVIVPELTEPETVDFFRRGVRGIVTRSIAPELLVRCVRKVFQGETWLDNRGVNWVMSAFRAQAAQLRSADPKHRLNEKELLIISGVTQGLRNKDIAQEIGTTEQVVKNYLRKIYDKLGISDRLELALYTVHQRLLENQRAAGEHPPEPAAGSEPPIPPEKPRSAKPPGAK
ncbi:MAG: response regulator transcription factor [Terriglobales bacterium]